MNQYLSLLKTLLICYVYGITAMLIALTTWLALDPPFFGLPLVFGGFVTISAMLLYATIIDSIENWVKEDEF